MSKNDKSSQGTHFVTSKDIAAYAKVSQSTVSRVFAHPDLVKPETVKTVMEAVDILGYRPNPLARGLNGKVTGLIALVSVKSNNPFYQACITKIYDMVRSIGKQVLFFQIEFEQELDDILATVSQYKVDGIIIISAAISSKNKKMLIQMDMPLVIFNKQFNSPNFFSVCSDNFSCGRMVAEYLVGKGYTSYGFISGKILAQTSDNRYSGFEDGLENNGYLCNVIANGDYTYESGYNALLQMKEKTASHLPQAIFCASDLMAFGAMDAARKELNLRIPEDIAFVGVDNLEQCDWKSYQLTSVSQPIDELCEYSKNYLIKRFANKETSEGFVLLNCKLVERQSS
jgi:DNA-binding LacI/PurR family transcriptional regulator